MTLVAVPCAVVSYSTCELVTRGTVTPGGGTGRGGNCMMHDVVHTYTYIYIYIYIYTLGRERCDGIQQNIALCALPVWVETGWE